MALDLVSIVTDPVVLTECVLGYTSGVQTLDGK